MKIAVFPGSFDPVTKGHEDIINRISPLFDKIYVAVGVNSNKKSFFPLEKRVQWLKECFVDNSVIEVATYDGLTIDFCREKEAHYIIRGVRNTQDFHFENDIAIVNKQLAPEIETLLLPTSPDLSYISSTVIREIYLNKGDYKKFMPDNIDLR